MTDTHHQGAWLLGLLGITLLAVALRFSFLGWDDWLALHPDERGILYRAEALSLPGSAAAFLQPDSPLNPLRSAGEETHYAYGHAHLYAVRSVASLLGFSVDLAGLSLAARLLSAFFDTLTVILSALFARRLYGDRAGLLAGAFACLTVALIQNAHFGTVDAGLTFWCLLSLYCLHRSGEKQDSALPFLAVGLSMGLAAGFKITAALLAIPMFLCWLLFRKPGRSLPSPFLPLGVAVLVFFVTNPYALIDAGAFLRSLSIQAQVVSGTLDWPFVYQYGEVIPMGTMLKDLVLFSLGLPLGMASLAGLIAVFIHWNRDRRPPDELPVYAFAAVFLVVVGLSEVPFPRYMLPAVPPLIIMGAGALVTIPSRPVSRVLAVTVLLSSGLYAAGFMAIYRASHPYIAASRWLDSTLGANHVILFERYDEPLPLPLPRPGGGSISLTDDQIVVIDSLAPASSESDILSALSRVDYVIIASPRVTNAISGSPARFPEAQAFYRALFAGDLGFSLDRSFSRPPHLGSLLFDTAPYGDFLAPSLSWPGPALTLGRADESFSLYDHPVVLIFTNDAHLDTAALTEALDAFR